MEEVVMLWIYFESRVNKFIDRLNVNCERKNRVKDISIYRLIKFIGLKSFYLYIL